MKFTLKLVILLAISLFINPSFSQGSLLLISDSSCEVEIDGESIIILEERKPKKVILDVGEHFLSSNNGNVIYEDVITIESGKQKVHKLTFIKGGKDLNEEGNNKKILVADLNIELEGEINYVIEESIDYSNENNLLYAFDEGDKLVLNGDLKNKKGKFNLSVLSYPDLNTIYSDKGLKDLSNKIIDIKKRGIYIIQIGTSSIFDKRVKLLIYRIIRDPDNIDFNTEVVKKYKYDVVEVVKNSNFINSTSNETWKNGTNEIIIPIKLPQNTVEWFYSFSASRDKQDIEANLKNVSLVNDLTEIVNGLNPTTSVINIGIDLLSKPPGADYCSIYLLDHYNSTLFQKDLEYRYFPIGTRQNLKSSTVKVACCTDGKIYYLGIENVDTYNGIHVEIEIAAITRTEYLDYE